MLPNFLCPGAQKAATTSLFHVLRRHPEVYLPGCKEVHYFDVEANEAKGVQWYERQFAKAAGRHKAVGEITPAYMYLDFIPGRIHRVLGEDVKFIFMLRQPIQRAISHYCMNVRLKIETESFERAIDLEADRIKGDVLQRKRFSYLDRGNYVVQIRRFLEYYPMKNMTFILFEDFSQGILTDINKVCDFLSVTPIERIRGNIQSNRTREKDVRPIVPDATREKLKEFFAPGIHELERLINVDLAHWLE